jgi:hypothetical protein
MVETLSNKSVHSERVPAMTILLLYGGSFSNYLIAIISATGTRQ